MQFLNIDRILRGQPPLGEIPAKKDIFRRTIQIAWPSILESFLVSLVGFIDTIMVSTLGTAAIAAVGLTTQPKFIGLAIFLSLNVAVSALVARRKGQDDRENANRVLVQSIMIVLILTIIVSIVCVAFADPIIRMAGSAEDTHEDAVAYFRIIMGGMFFNVMSLVINAAQRGAGNTKIALKTNLVSNGVNIIFNYLLIGGNLGFPKLGVSGAAIATVIGTVFAFGMSVYSVTRHKDRFLCLRVYHRLHFDRATMGAILNIGSSTLAEQIFLRIGFLTYAIIVANLGTVAFAAHQVGMNIMSLSFSLGDGLSVAAVALVGQSLGANRGDLAKIYGGVCQRIGLIFACIMSVVFVCFGRYIFMLFSSDPEILDYGQMIMDLLTVVVFFQITQVIFSGCLRGAGDTRYTALVSLISVAFIRPFSGWLFCYPLALGLFGAWLGLAFDQIMRFILTWVRFRRGRWTNIKI